MRKIFQITTDTNDTLAVLSGSDQNGPLVELTIQDWDYCQMTPREAIRLGNALLRAAESAKDKAKKRASKAEVRR